MPKEMEVKGQRGVKGRQRKGHEQDGGGPKRARLDGTTVSYLRRVSERLNEGFAEDEEKGLFVENVLSEVKGKAVTVATDMTGSLALQRLLSLAAAAQVGEVLSELGGEAGSEFRGVACDPCGGHVMETALRQAHRWTEEEEEEADPSEEEHCGTLEAQVVRLSAVVRENVFAFAKDSYGSHVLRTLIHTLAGCRSPEPTGKKDKKTQPEPLLDFEIPPSFWWELKHLSASVMEIIKECVSDPNAGAVMQTLLTVCHRKRPVLCRKLNKSIVGYLESLSSAEGVSPLLVFLKDPSCSRVLQTVFLSSHKALLRRVYRKHLRTHLMPLALHPIANYPVQSLISACQRFPVFLKVFDELMEGFEAVLAAGHMGVVVQMAESCVHWEEKQNELLQRLLQAFHCSEPKLQTSCLPLFLSLLTYEVYFSTETAEGAAATQRPLSVSYHGSRLVQALSGFKDRSLLMNSLHHLRPAELLSLGTDRSGTHALQSLVTRAAHKSRARVLHKMEDLLLPLACSACGSRLLEAVWSSATVSQKQSIAEKLVPSESQLRSDQFARHVWAKFGLTNFQKRRADWQEVQTGEAKKRKMFSEILS